MHTVKTCSHLQLKCSFHIQFKYNSFSLLTIADNSIIIISILLVINISSNKEINISFGNQRWWQKITILQIPHRSTWSRANNSVANLKKCDLKTNLELSAVWTQSERTNTSKHQMDTLLSNTQWEPLGCRLIQCNIQVCNILREVRCKTCQMCHFLNQFLNSSGIFTSNYLSF